MCSDCPPALARDLDLAFPEFLAHHEDLVYAIALRLTRRPADAEDLAQEAFVRAYRALRAYAPERTRGLRPRGWLAAIVTNLARNRARRRPLATAGLEAASEARADDRSRPDRIVDGREAGAAWRRRLEGLPPRYARAVALRHVHGLSYPELAAALGRPEGTVKSDVHRGVRLLRAAYLREGSEERVNGKASVSRERSLER